jgi:predicted DNA-binding protein
MKSTTVNTKKTYANSKNRQNGFVLIKIELPVRVYPTLQTLAKRVNRTTGLFVKQVVLDSIHQQVEDYKRLEEKVNANGNTRN